MKVLVTGGAGRMGLVVVERLARAGHELIAIGRHQHAEVHGARYAQCDVTDLAALLPAVKDRDAIVHLAAIPAPGGLPPEEIFRINCCGTFNVYEAAARAGIRRVVCASSINAVGFNFGIKPFPIPYVPVDEEMPGFTTDVYSLSKQITERIAEYAWRRNGISGVCLRLPWIAPPEFSERDTVMAHAQQCRARLQELLALPENARRKRIAAQIAYFDRCRGRRCPEDEAPEQVRSDQDSLMVGRSDFWTRIDERDAALAVERALQAGYEGCHTLFVNDSHNLAGVPSAMLARLYLPEAQVRSERLPGTATLVSIEAARQVIGFEPEHSVGRWF